jgi:hypothetical protein
MLVFAGSLPWVEYHDFYIPPGLVWSKELMLLDPYLIKAERKQKVLRCLLVTTTSASFVCSFPWSFLFIP